MNIIKAFFIHVCLFLLLLFFAEIKWPNGLLFAAQIIFVPILFLSIVKPNELYHKYFPYLAGLTYFALILLYVFPSKWNGLFAFIYLLFTMFLAIYGIKRFIQRGFTNIEEFLIDCGFIFLAVGGMWFFAVEAGFDTGFSSIISWLTAIHFHYSACLFLIFFGLLGRLWKPTYYPWMATFAILLPWVMAIGISFSPWIEVFGAVLYIILVYYLIIYCLNISFPNRIQKGLVTIAFSAVGLTIIFAFLYVLSNGFDIFQITIGWMLIFHGILNAGVFGLLGVIGFIIDIPKTVYQKPVFPVSQIQRKYKPKEKAPSINGLVDNMGIYLTPQEKAKMANTVVDFYEQTMNYRLFASVQWRRWFKPFAWIYKCLSKITEQINLPLSARKLEMTGDIYQIPDELDGRKDVRAWVRKGNGQTIFIALYSYHKKDRRTYMNIALPLPFTSMHGILALEPSDTGLILTSVRKNKTMEDAGIYLVFGQKIRFRLPLAETFYVEETKDGKLTATHQMEICGLSFLTIDYDIERR